VRPRPTSAETAAVARIRDQRLHHVADALGDEHREQGDLAAVDVPSRERGVLGAAVRHVHGAVHARVPPVDVAQDGGTEQRVVEHRVERPAVGALAAADLDPAQQVAPCCACAPPDLRERPRRQLGGEVRARAVHVDERDADAHPDGPVVPGIERDVRARLRAVARAARVRQRGQRPELDGLDGVVAAAVAPATSVCFVHVPYWTNGRSNSATKKAR
jgi:hypothetical protein